MKKKSKFIHQAIYCALHGHAVLYSVRLSTAGFDLLALKQLENKCNQSFKIITILFIKLLLMLLLY